MQTYTSRNTFLNSLFTLRPLTGAWSTYLYPIILKLQHGVKPQKLNVMAFALVRTLVYNLKLKHQLGK